ncbi:hypothetical protein BC831DRAFT_461507 [Entophlyctis helioformis]|nr:hypothetical protein BC831DRAFT_461507 [Entophlyctis helioformis]
MLLLQGVRRQALACAARLCAEGRLPLQRCGLGAGIAARNARSRWTSSSSSSSTPVPALGLLQAAHSHAERTAITDAQGGRHSYGSVLQDSLVLRSLLLSQTRSQPLANASADLCGRRVAFLMPRGRDYAVSLYATWAAGGIAVPLCTSHPPAEIEYTIQDSGSDTVLYHPSLHHIIESLPAKLPSSVRWIPSTAFPTGSTQVDPPVFKAADKSQGALIIYTSGTTGRPKGVLTTHDNIEAMVTSLVDAWKWTASDVIHHVLPLHHVHGVVNAFLCCLWSGAVCEFSADKFDATQVWRRWMASRHLTLFMAVPTVYAKLIHAYDAMSKTDQAAARESCRQFRLMVSGSSALPISVFSRWESISGHRLLERYGMTEIGMALGNPLDGPRVPGQVGKPFPGVSLLIRDERGRDVSRVPDAPGALLVRGPQVFREYWNRPQATAESFEEPGHWFVTGDTACATDDGSYRILGRTSVDVLKSGGYKVSAIDVEREILECSHVSEVAVVGRESEEWGQTIAAIVVPKAGKTVTLDMLREWLKPRVAPYKLPTSLLVVDELPKNAMGKINKKQLVKLFDKAPE